MCQYPGVAFHPWVGSRYGRNSRFRARVLVLGESHYDAPENLTEDYTQHVVRKWGQELPGLREPDGPQSLPFFTKATKVLLRCKSWPTRAERKAVWEEGAFYNVVQSFTGEKARAAPTFRQWYCAQKPFDVVLSALRPDGVLVLGYRVARHLLGLTPDWRSVAYAGECETVAATVLKHPSGGMRYEESIAGFEDLLGRATAGESTR